MTFSTRNEYNWVMSQLYISDEDYSLLNEMLGNLPMPNKALSAAAKSAKKKNKI